MVTYSDRRILLNTFRNKVCFLVTTIKTSCFRPEVIALFDKYVDNNVRHLTKEEAVAMLCKEFDLSPNEAENLFETFDKDHNGMMSVWEFQQFYTTVGNK